MSGVDDKVLYGRAFEAVVWGMPAVNYRLMYDAGSRPGTPGSNKIVWWPGLMDWQNQSLTPNPDVIYVMPFFDTTNGPVVLEIPAATDTCSINGSVMNYWQAAIEDVGSAGLDNGAGAKYLILPPGYTGIIPDGYTLLQSDTVQGYAMVRSTPTDHSPESIDAAVAYAEQVALYPYTPDGATGQTIRVSVLGKSFDAEIPYDDSYFATLNTLVQAEPWLERDRALIDTLSSLGITQGETYAPDQATLDILTTAIGDAKTWLDARYENLFTTPRWPGTHWSVPVLPELNTSTTNGFTLRSSYPLDDRGLAFTYAFFSPRHLGKGQSYLMALADQNGDPLDGGQRYRLTVPKDVPVSQYWSLTAYDRGTHTFLRTDRLSSCSLDTSLDLNEDGTVDLYLAPALPDGVKESNWITTLDSTGFEVMFRLYGPQQAYTDGTWTLPDLQRL
ncbi:DUF1214 domain-containing protein [Streptomyces sp. NPDC094448]|uniref:DUF1214 domain-containing protein n=1 Tax=Streptomyces sp. NPDC094448 TaxID=3366063 RepID=UPI003814D795